MLSGGVGRTCQSQTLTEDEDRHVGASRSVDGDIMNMRRIGLGLAVVAFALGVGFVAGVAVLLVLNTVLPPFRPEDDDTLREFVPVVLAYATMASTAVLAVVVAWRRIRRRVTAER